MKLLQRIGFLVLLLCATGLAVYGYFSLKEIKKPIQEAINVLPDSCLIYAQSKNIKTLIEQVNSQNIIFDKLKNNLFFNQLSNQLSWIDSVLNFEEIKENDLQKNTFHFAYYNNYKNWAITTNYNNSLKQNNLEVILTKTFKSIATQTHYSFYTHDKQLVFYVFYDGLIIFSNNEDLLQKCLNKNSKLSANNDFKQFYIANSNNQKLLVYLNHKLINNTNTKLSNIKNLRCENFSVDLEPTSITANGNLYSDSNCVLELCKGIEAQSFIEDEFLPNTTIEFTKYNYNNNNLGRADFWKTITDSALYNIRNEFYENFNSSITEFKTKNQFQSQVLVTLNETILLTKHLDFMLDSVINANDVKICRLKKFTKLFYPFTETTFNYVTVVKNHVCFSTSLNDAINYSTQISEGKTLSKNTSFINYKTQQLSETYNYLHYQNIGLNNGAINNFIKLEKAAYQNFKHFSYTLSNYKNNFKLRINLKYESDDDINQPSTIWACKLDTTVSNSINKFYNHNTKQNEIVAQDVSNKIYLIDNKGNVLWKNKLKEKVISKIYMVDIFKNGKLQMLFNTANYIHLIDRNGNYVSGYPVKLPDETSNPISLFDYDNDKNYRIFVACKNKKIYNYTIYGIKQDGFTPFICDNLVKLPMQYVKVGLSDYIVAVDELGKIYTISRKGEGRIGLKNKTIENCLNFYVDATNGIASTYLIYLDLKNDALHKISFADKKEIVKFNAPVTNANTSFDLLDENRTTDVLISNQNQVIAYDFNGNIIFEKEFQYSEPSQSNFFANENTSLLATHFETNNILKIINTSSNKLKTFNATSTPLFYNLFNDNKPYIIYPNGNYINCSLINN